MSWFVFQVVRVDDAGKVVERFQESLVLVDSVHDARIPALLCGGTDLRLDLVATCGQLVQMHPGLPGEVQQLVFIRANG